MGKADNREAVFVLNPEPDVLAASPVYRDMPTAADRLRALGSALAASPGFHAMEDVTLVVRTAPPARLALLGTVSEAEAARIEAIPTILNMGLRRLRYVTWEEAERCAHSLARQLVEALGRDTLSRCRFLGLPRGGVFPLGMLAYLLDLRAWQLGDPALSGSPDAGTPGDAPLILVDDCALTGLRCAETLARTDASRVVFAHLFSHPGLREAIEGREDRVVGCYAGEDLADLADELLDDRAAWEARWRERSDGRAYWLGLPEHVCFPWNEPDITIWNERTGAEEAPWRVLPPRFCLKNRPAPRSSVRLQEQISGEGPFRPGDATVFARFDERVLAADVETGRAYSFEGIAGEIWTALVAGADPESVVGRLAGEYDVGAARVRADLDSLVERAVGVGLLRRFEHV